MSSAKAAIIGFLVGAAAVAVPLVLQQQSVSALRQENDTLKQQAAQVAPLQEQLNQATQQAASAGGNAEAQTRVLARLRAEVIELRKKTNDLAKAQDQIGALNQRIADAAEQNKNMAAAAQAQQAQQTQAQIAAITQAARAMSACINNLRLIDSAKQQWALENKKTAADTPTWDDLRPYIGRGPNGDLPVCPSGGVYTIGTVGEKPTCGVAGHALP